jgi:hypothetical protein
MSDYWDDDPSGKQLELPGFGSQDENKRKQYSETSESDEDPYRPHVDRGYSPEVSVKREIAGKSIEIYTEGYEVLEMRDRSSFPPRKIDLQGNRFELGDTHYQVIVNENGVQIIELVFEEA